MIDFAQMWGYKSHGAFAGHRFTINSDMPETETSSPSWKELLCRRSLTAIVAMDPLIGTIADDRFEILSVIGTGACSKVYKARQLDPNRLVALKLLHLNLLKNTETVARFQREAESGVGLNHINITKVHEHGRLSTGQPYIAMEYLEGESLASLLRRNEFLPALEAVPIFISCCRGLTAAHNQGIVHRDIKPANIFVHVSGADRTIKLLDFGLAKVVSRGEPSLTQTGTALGTVRYMSPEQILTEPIDARTDIYSLACVMFETLSGRAVFDARTALEVMDQHLHKPAGSLHEANPNAAIRGDLENIVLKSLSKDPDERFQSAEELKLALQRVLDEIQPARRSVHLWKVIFGAVLFTACWVLAI